MTLLLDTNILIDVLKNRGESRRFVEELVERGHTLATSTISIGEVYAGMRRGEEARTDSLLSSIEAYPVNARIAVRGGQLVNEWRRRGRTLSLDDMLIAATALENELAFMTDNRKDFPMPELTFYPSV